MSIKSKLSFLFLLFFTAIASAATPLDRVLVVVNDSVITEVELENRLQLVKKQLGPHKSIPDAELRLQLLDKLILDKIQQQLAERSGIQIDDATLEQAIASIIKDNQLSSEEFKHRLAQDGIDYDTFKTELRHDMMTTQLQRREIVAQVTVSETEIDHYLRSPEGQNHASTEYHLRHILIALPNNPTPDQIQATELEAQTLLNNLEQKPDDFSSMAVRHSKGQQALQGGDLGWRRSAELPTLFSEPVLTMKIGQVAGLFRNPSGFHIIQLVEKRQHQAEAAVMQSHVRHILTKDREGIYIIHAMLKAGGDFKAIAQDSSEDLGSRDTGGDIGWIAPEDVVPEFRRVMNSLPIGQISDPFESNFGWHILEVLERKEVTMTAEAARAKAMKILQSRKFEEKLNDWLRQIRAQAFVEILPAPKHP